MERKTNDDSSLSHTRWNCKYHIVFIAKYRRKEIYGKLRSDIGLVTGIPSLHLLKILNKGGQIYREEKQIKYSKR